MNKSERYELADILMNKLSRNFASFFKVYAELAKRADATNHSLSCSIDELAKHLGYSPDYLNTILVDLLTFNIIDIRIGYKDSTKRKVTLLVH